ncbi:pentatricopeptide repeat-containing protein At2g45350, chloroplastic [Impatiens glandulifera]|uniref:pentatricopeptide repeat-containing protein At2g45350, chloroplastic n=1 Tax=Impatiens glandulifera TaxID=253017 RepID=UPI001FB0CF95|nr:pentatricopeptide repeat-containing protein At2g45350, chloroplastic [Impatiens glandulifera]
MTVCANSNHQWHSTTLSLFPKCKTLRDVQQIHAHLTKTGLINNQSLTTKLILKFCASPHAPVVRFARYLFFRKTLFDPFIWNAIIKTFSHGHDPLEAMLIFSLMLENGVLVDKYSFSLLLKACSRMALVKEGMQLHGLIEKFDFGYSDDELFLNNCLICLYLRCGCHGLARRVFDRMHNRDSVSFNLMIDGYVKSGTIDSARELFVQMPVEIKNSISWNSMIRGYMKYEEEEEAWELFNKMPERDLVSWNLMLDGYIKRGRIETAQALFNEMPQRDVVSWASMIDGYGKLGWTNIARSLFDKMPDRDIVSCNTMMAAYLQNGNFTEALKLFHDVQTETNLSPDEATLSIALSSIAQLGLIDEGVAIHNHIVEKRFSLDGNLGVALIDMYSKCGDIVKGIKIFENIKHKRRRRSNNVDHWNAMINGLAIHGYGKSAFELFMEMMRKQSIIRPDDITYIGVINACGHSGLIKEGLMCFEIMRRVHRLEPKLQHYGCVIDVLGRAGHIEEATKLIREMPIKPNEVVWRTLLSACNNYESFKIGEPIAKHLIELDSSKSSGYVILSNIYACFGLWDDVRKVREMMKQNDIKKLPGSSWIELDGQVHQFFAGDKSSS